MGTIKYLPEENPFRRVHQSSAVEALEPTGVPGTVR